MRESTAEILRQLELELLRMDDFRWRLERMSQEELSEVAGVLSAAATSLGQKAQQLAELASFIRPLLARQETQLRS
jgi:hypothetical protein